MEEQILSKVLTEEKKASREELMIAAEITANTKVSNKPNWLKGISTASFNRLLQITSKAAKQLGGL